MRCYVAGPMRGIPDGNFPAFDSLSNYMRANGWDVYSPADNDREAGMTGEQAGNPKDGNFKSLMRLDLWQVCDSDAIVLLPGWEHSKGAQLEKHVATEVGTEVLYAYPIVDAGHENEWFVSDTYLDGPLPTCEAEMAAGAIPVQGVC